MDDTSPPVITSPHISYWKGKHHSEESRKKMSESKRGENHPNYGKHLSEETKRKISLSLKERIKSEEHRRSLSQALKGRVLPEETKRKISLALIDKSHTEEHKRKISLAQKGKVNIGKTPWMKGKHHHEEVRRRLSKIHKNKQYSPETQFKPGHRCSKETLEKISQALKGRKFSEDHKQKIRIARLKQVLPQKDTAIEVKIQNELKRMGVPFKKHLALCGVCQPDIIIPEKKTVIFCDGDYWHNLPRIKNRDKRQDRVLSEKGWKVYRFWEHEINLNPSGCVDKIMGEIVC